MWASIIGVGLNVGSSLYSGGKAKQSAFAQASDLEYQGNVLYQEAFRTAAIVEEEGEKFAQNQSLQYLSSGVELVGSALIHPMQTRMYAGAEAESHRSRGRAQRNLPFRSANVLRNEGRASMISGIMKAGASGISALSTKSGSGGGPDIKTSSGSGYRNYNSIPVNPRVS